MDTSYKRQKVRFRIVHTTYNVIRHWLAIFIFLFGVFNVLPFLAPMAMRLGWTSVADAIYTLYLPMCHQMAQRSFFFFGEKVMYNLDELPLNLTGQMDDHLTLRYFRGNETLGWKIAWSDRMVYMYGSIWVGAIIYGLALRKKRIKPLSVWVFILLCVPMAIDGITHALSDLDGLMDGFRYANPWLAELTANALPANFYRGDTLGSFNSWMRLISGVSFGLGFAGLALPFIDQDFRRTERLLKEKLEPYRMQPALKESQNDLVL